MNKIFMFLFILVYSLLLLVPSCYAMTNFAKGKSYVVSPPQNYNLTAPESNKTVLTDGVYTTGNFWTQKSTVGWAHTKWVEILIDLERISSIGSILFSTAQGTGGGVDYPDQIDVFVGQDREHLLYVGDLMAKAERTPKRYETKRLRIDGVDSKGRYVLLLIQGHGSFVFCDEIEVLKGKNPSGRQGLLTLEQARAFSRRKGFLYTMMEELKAASYDNDKSRLRLPATVPEQHILPVNGATATSPEKIEAEVLSVLKKRLLLRRDLLGAKQPGQTLLIRSVDPWSQFSPTSPLTTRTTDVKASLFVPIGGYAHNSLEITNISTKPQQFTISLSKPESIIAGIDLYHIPFVKSATMEYVADPLVQMNEVVNLLPGESRLIFVTAFGKKMGIWKGELKISNGNLLQIVPVDVQTVKVKLPKTLALNSVNWGYLDFGLIRNRKELATKDLAMHHTNVLVVPPKYLPHLEKNSEDPEFSLMRHYLKVHKGVTKIMLFMNFRAEERKNVNGLYHFMDEEWKASFIKWYGDVLTAIVKAGFSKDYVYFYPFDEMRGKDIDQFIAFAAWARKAIPEIKLYATIASRDSERALPYLDIAQIAVSLSKKFPEGKNEKWIYTGSNKSLSPYSYYRLMAWKAFSEGYRGIGFWAYADTGWGDNPGNAWDDFDGKDPKYAVIYEGEGNTIISSRRWEAWRMGIEDYELLTMYSKAKGDAAAKMLAKSVLDNPLDTTKADEVRKKILLELSK